MCLLLLAGMPLLIQSYMCWNTVLFVMFVVSGKTKFHATCVYAKCSE